MDNGKLKFERQFSHSFVHGFDARMSCCFARSYLKMESTLDTLVMLLESSNVFLAASESILLYYTYGNDHQTVNHYGKDRQLLFPAGNIR